MNWMQQITEFMPHGMCLLWRPELMALHVASDALIALSYFAIPIVIAVFVQRRTDLESSHRAIALLFAAFITLCGLTHVASIVVLWQPAYISEGWLKAVTAIVSVVTAASLPVLLPQLLRIPSPRALQKEVEAHRATLAELDRARAELARRVDVTEHELRITNRRFETALRASTVTVYEQDADLRYTWVYNPPLGLDPQDLIGRTEADFFTPESVQAMQSLKRDALASGEPRHGEVAVDTGQRFGWFEVRVEPIDLEDGRPGLVATANDVTLRHRHEAHLQLLMREMNHRAKNVLAMVMGIARQTARSFNLPDGFEERLSERLTSLASAHDVLARQEWLGADLKAVLEGQLRHHIDTYGERIVIEGGPLDLPPEAAHYVGLALHELGSNAVKHGALSGPEGVVHASWRVLIAETGARTLELVWRESGFGPVSAPTRSGFGATILNTLVARALQGESRSSFGADGMAWTLTAPLTAEVALAA